MKGSVRRGRRGRRVVATLAIAGSLLAGCSRFESERAELRHEHVVLNADPPVVVAAPVD